MNRYRYRVGRVTASIVDDVIRYRGVCENNSIVKKILTENMNVSTPAMVYGKEREPLTRRLFDIHCENEHEKHI